MDDHSHDADLADEYVPPKAPTKCRAAGRRLWRSVVEDFELGEHELALLAQAVRTVDQLENLQKLVADEGPIVNTPGGPKAHPALVEARQQRIALARLLAVLRLPFGDGGDTQKGALQRRDGFRGVYGITGAVG